MAGCEWIDIIIRIANIDAIHSQYGDLPRAVPCFGSLLLLQHNPQYVLMKPFRMCSLADFGVRSFGIPSYVIGARCATPQIRLHASLDIIGSGLPVVRDVDQVWEWAEAEDVTRSCHSSSIAIAVTAST